MQSNQKRVFKRIMPTWFISEHCKSCERKTSVQSNQKRVFKRIMPHSPVYRNIVLFILFFMIEACAVELLCSAS